jgi:hypothetical protein
MTKLSSTTNNGGEEAEAEARARRWREVEASGTFEQRLEIVGEVMGSYSQLWRLGLINPGKRAQLWLAVALFGFYRAMVNTTFDREPGEAGRQE